MEPSDQSLKLTIEASDIEQFNRFDKYLDAKCPDLSRSLIKKLFEENQITSQVNLSLKKMPPVGSIIYINIPKSRPTELLAQDIPLTILYEDNYLVIIDKPAGLVTHPAPGNYDGTLVNAILHHCPNLIGVGGEVRPGIVHRLDKGTSGVMVVAKEQKTHEKLVEMFSKHDLTRIYTAILVGDKINTSGKIETQIGRSNSNRLKMTTMLKNGKLAISEYTRLKTREYLTLAEFKLHTGRTHQIRVHASEILKAPIFGDELYGNPNRHKKHLPIKLQKLINDYPYPMLHAKTLEFIHPITGKQLSFTTEPPTPHLELREWINES